MINNALFTTADFITFGVGIIMGCVFLAIGSLADKIDDTGGLNKIEKIIFFILCSGFVSTLVVATSVCFWPTATGLAVILLLDWLDHLLARKAQDGTYWG